MNKEPLGMTDDACHRSTWEPPPHAVELPNDEVHVWRFGLDSGGAARAARLWQILTEDERGRADRFRFEKDRSAYVTARGVLREILGGYLRRPPGNIRFSYGPWGKPSVAGESGPDGLRFNLSHSHELALVAVARGREVGVDVERIREGGEELRLAEHYFSPGEIAVLRSLPIDQQARAFFACWTRKEAFIKATGTGLSTPLDQFDVSLASGEPAALLRTAWDAKEATRWRLRAIDPEPGYAAAVAVAGDGWRLRCRHYAAAAGDLNA